MVYAKNLIKKYYCIYKLKFFSFLISFQFKTKNQLVSYFLNHSVQTRGTECPHLHVTIILSTQNE